MQLKADMSGIGLIEVNKCPKKPELLEFIEGIVELFVGGVKH